MDRVYSLIQAKVVHGVPRYPKKKRLQSRCFFFPCAYKNDADRNRAPHGEAALLRRTSVFATGKALAQGQFICPGHLKYLRVEAASVAGIQKERHDHKSCLSFWRRHPDSNWG